MFCNDGEFGSEVYSGATTEKQAWEVFKPAKLMVTRSPDLLEATGIVVNAGSLAIPTDGSLLSLLLAIPEMVNRLIALLLMNITSIRILDCMTQCKQVWALADSH